MDEDDEGEDGYEVGYGRPPRESQWQKGESGNPRGRPKREDTLDAFVERADERQIEYVSGGQLKRSPSSRLGLEQLYSRALKGDRHAANQIVKLLQNYYPSRGFQPPHHLYPVDTPVTTEHLEIFRKRGFLPAAAPEDVHEIPIEVLQEAFQKHLEAPREVRRTEPDEDDWGSL